MEPARKPSLNAVGKAVGLAWEEKDTRRWKRLKAIELDAAGQEVEAICAALDVSRRSVFYWTKRFRDGGLDGLKEGEHPGRPGRLSSSQRDRLEDILDSGPVAYGFRSGIWTCPRVGRVIQEEFDVTYHEDHVRKILHRLGFSVQRPKKTLVRADPRLQQKWIRETYEPVARTPLGA
jgi:transposase